MVIKQCVRVKESTPETPKEKTPLDYFKQFLEVRAGDQFIGYWAKVTKTPAPVLIYARWKILTLEDDKKYRLKAHLEAKE